MSARYAQVVLLCEDSCHETFARRYLQGIGFKPRQIRVTTSPTGRGAAEQFVRNEFAKELKTCQARACNTKLVVAIDADTMTVAEREGQLQGSLNYSQFQKIRNALVALLIPKRNIETWIFFLLGNNVDEATDYKRDVNCGKDCHGAVNALLKARKQSQLPLPNCPSSLQKALGELKRLDRQTKNSP